MNLDAAQKTKVTEWINNGLKLADIQKKIATDLGLTMTYMEVRFLVDDLKLTPKDPEPPKTPESPLTAPAGATPKPATAPSAATPEPEQAAGGGTVSLTVDEITRPGAIVSGKVTFSDGQPAEWYLDQTGRLGLTPKQQGYRPPAADVQEFQLQLQNALAKLGF